MTDKQIINGVDVSGCKHYKNRTCIADYCLTDMPFGEAKCELNPNCYYKQLKRKEQECYEYIKELIRFQQEVVPKLRKRLRNKEQEYEKLKEKCKKYGEINEQETKDYAELKAENEILKEKFEIAIKNNMDKTLLRLEKGDVQEELQEIREQFGIETLYCHDDNTRVHRCLDVLKLKDTLTEIKDIANLLDLDTGEEYNFGNIELEIKQLKAKEQENKEIIEKYRSVLEEIREDMEQDTTCESRECGCDDYAECLNCIKETILNKISEVLNV